MDKLEEDVYSFLSEAPSNEIFSLIRLIAKELKMDDDIILGAVLKMWDGLQEKKAIELGYRVEVKNGQ